jgi:hypothetical protein
MPDKYHFCDGQPDFVDVVLTGDKFRGWLLEIEDNIRDFFIHFCPFCGVKLEE